MLQVHDIITNNLGRNKIGLVIAIMEQQLGSKYIVIKKIVKKRKGMLSR